MSISRKSPSCPVLITVWRLVRHFWWRRRWRCRFLGDGINMGIPKWMVYMGKKPSYKRMIIGGIAPIYGKSPHVFHLDVMKNVFLSDMFSLMPCLRCFGGHLVGNGLAVELWILGYHGIPGALGPWGIFSLELEIPRSQKSRMCTLP